MKDIKQRRKVVSLPPLKTNRKYVDKYSKYCNSLEAGREKGTFCRGRVRFAAGFSEETRQASRSCNDNFKVPEGKLSTQNPPPAKHLSKVKAKKRHLRQKLRGLTANPLKKHHEKHEKEAFTPDKHDHQLGIWTHLTCIGVSMTAGP